MALAFNKIGGIHLPESTQYSLLCRNNNSKKSSWGEKFPHWIKYLQVSLSITLLVSIYQLTSGQKKKGKIEYCCIETNAGLISARGNNIVLNFLQLSSEKKF